MPARFRAGRGTTTAIQQCVNCESGNAGPKDRTADDAALRRADRSGHDLAAGHRKGPAPCEVDRSSTGLIVEAASVPMGANYRGRFGCATVRLPFTRLERQGYKRRDQAIGAIIQPPPEIGVHQESSTPPGKKSVGPELHRTGPQHTVIVTWITRPPYGRFVRHGEGPCRAGALHSMSGSSRSRRRSRSCVHGNPASAHPGTTQLHARKRPLSRPSAAGSRLESAQGVAAETT